MGNTMNKNYQKSLLDVYSTTAQTLITGQAVAYTGINVDTGCSIEYLSPTSARIVKPGVYKVSFIGVASASVVGNVTLQVQRDGVLIPAATATETYANTTDLHSFAIETLVRVPPSCCVIQNQPVISVVNTGVGAVFNTAKLMVTKVC